MSYKNTLKLFASNFMLVWKHLLFLFICVAIFAACSVSVSRPLLNVLKTNGAGQEIISIFKTAYNTPSELFMYISTVFRHIFRIIFDNFGHIYLSLIGLFFFAFLIPYILIQMSTFNISSILYLKLSMNMDTSYFHNGVKNLKTSFLFALSNILFNLPFFALNILFLFIYLQVAKTILGSILGLIGLSALMLLLRSIKISIFTCYTGYIVENNCSPFVAFGKGIASITKYFWKVLSISIVILLTIIFVNGFIAIFTFLAGLIVLIPATYVFLAIYNLVTYFNIKGDRYYLGSNLIFNPVKYTVKHEEYIDRTVVPEEPTEIQITTTVIKKRRKKTKSN